MHRPLHALLAGLAVLTPMAARANEAPDLCVNRPGLDTPACTLSAGRVMIEMGLTDWEHAASAAARTDSLTFGDALLRVGLGKATELELGFGGWTRTRSRVGGLVTATHGTGDMSFAVRHGFGGEAGAKVAVQAFVSVPMHREGVWGAGFLVPIALPLPAGFALSATPEVDAAVNGSGHGRHLAWGGALGLSHGLAPKLSASAEVSALRDQDPGGASTESRLALAAAWHAAPSLQIDVEFDTGLTPGTPDHALLLGFAQQF